LTRERGQVQDFARFFLEHVNEPITFFTKNFEIFLENLEMESWCQHATSLVPLLSCAGQQSSLQKRMDDIVDSAFANVLGTA
jgi:hypothetical protein